MTTETNRDHKTTIRMQSQHAGEEVLCARWGQIGTPVLLFPTAGGDGEECERFKMIYALRPLLEAGKIKIYSCDSIGGRAMSAQGRTTASYAAAQARFDRFIRHELVPWIRHDCESPDIEIVTAGASIGAFNAVAALCKHPDVFKAAIGMSGTYDLTKWLGPPYPLDFYLSSPVHFLPRLPDDSEQMKLLRTRTAYLPTGDGPWEEPAQSWKLANVLGSRGVPNRVDQWGADYDHNWPTWREMLPKYLEKLTS